MAEIEVVEVTDSAGITVVEVTIPGPQGPSGTGGGGGTGDVTKVGTPADNQIGVWTGDGTIEGDSALTFDTGTDTLTIAASGNIAIGAVTIIDDNAGTTTLQNIDALDATTESTIEAAIDTLANLTSIQGQTVTLADAGADAFLAWDDSASKYQNLSAADAVAIIDSADSWLKNVVEDTTPQLGGNLDANTFNIQFNDATGILSTEAGNPELLIFSSAAAAANYIQVANSATGTYPAISAQGSDTEIGISFEAKGTITAPADAFAFNCGVGASPHFYIFNTENSGGGPIIEIKNISASPAANDEVAAQVFSGRDTVGNDQVYAAIAARILDATSTSEDGEFVIKATVAGAVGEQLKTSNGVIIGTGTTYPGSGNLAFSDAKGIYDDGGNEQLIFQKNASAVNYLEIENTVTGTFPIIRPAGSDADIGITFQAKGNITGGLAAFEFVLGSGEGAEVLIQNTATGGSGPILNIQNYSASPAVADEVGAIYFGSKDSAGPGHQVYGTISSIILDETSGSEDGETVLKTVVAGAIAARLKISNGVIIGSGTTYPGDGNVSLADAKGIFDGAGNEQLIFQQTASAVNEFEITNASTGNYPQLAVTGGDSAVGMTFKAKGNLTSGVDVFQFDMGTTPNGNFDIFNTEDSGSGPALWLRNISSSPAASDELGNIFFVGKDSAAGTQTYGVISGRILDATSTSEDGEVAIKTPVNASFADRLKVADGVIIGSSSVYPGSGNLRVTNIELGHDTDTTLTRSSAGVLAVEGVPVALTGKQTIWIPATAMTARTTNGAASGSTEVSPNLIMLKTLDFDTTTQEFAQFTVCLPKSWNHGTVTFVPVWSHALTTVNFGVTWGLAGVCIGDDDDGVQPFGTAVTSVDTGGTTNNIYEGPESSAITILGDSPLSDAEFCSFQINRTVSDGGDTLGIDARLHGIKLFYTTNVGNDA